jgi:hypothetical protein
MRISILYLSIAIMNFLILNCIAQTSHEVSQPSLELRDNKLIILYDIKNFNPEETFKVWIEITDAEGNTINAKSLTGDIGDNITGGNNKEITWDFIKDDFNTDTEIYVEVSAEKIAPVQIAAEEVVPLETDREEAISEESIPKKKVSTGSLLWRSAILPGLGFVKMDKSKLHLAKGVAGYACIASSVIFNRLAVSNYNKYLDSYEIEKSDDYFNKSVRQDNTSEVLAYTAIGIWAAEIIWILVESKNFKSTATAHGNRISIEPRYDLYSNTSMICFSYNF